MRLAFAVISYNTNANAIRMYMYITCNKVRIEGPGIDAIKFSLNIFIQIHHIHI